jgi:hypothetical protein
VTSVAALTIAVCAAFLVLALWHFRMAFARATANSGAVPSVDGKALFVPSRAATVTVAVLLVAFAALVAETGGLLPLLLPRRALVWLSYGLALGLLGRAIGEFRYVGFFKRVRGSRFAKLDTLVYSPVCLLLAIGVALIVRHSGE